MKIIVVFAVLLISQVLGLTFTNEKCNGKDCDFRVTSITFSKYTLNVKGVNSANRAIQGGDVTVVVDIQIFFWMNAYSSTDPACSYAGTDCQNGVLVPANSEKSFQLTMSTDSDPPSGTYRGTAHFYNSDGSYSNVKMNWQCDSDKCY